MTAVPRTRVRNLGILAHVDAGKTTITERVLYLTGATYKSGEVHDGTTVTDFDEQERDRGITIYAAAVSCTWDDHRLNLIDTPGHVDFSAEVERSLRVLDGAVVAFDCVAGVETQSEAVWRQADRYGVPRIAFVNKLDRAGADLDAAVVSIEERLRTTAFVLQVPIGEAESFVGVVDLVRMRALRWQRDREGYVVEPVPAELLDRAVEARRQLEEAVAQRHGVAFDEFCATQVLTDDTLASGLRGIALAGDGVIVLCGSAYRNIGIEPMLDAVVSYLPSPLDIVAAEGHGDGGRRERAADPAAPFAGLVFKIAGRLAFVRVYSGTLRRGDAVLDPGAERVERVGRIVRVQADRHSDVEEAVAGDIVAVIGLKAARTGATLCAPSDPLVFEPATVAEPLVAVALEARRGTDSQRLTTALRRLAAEDPSLRVATDPETGQTLLSGLGELHLEVAVERLRRTHSMEVVVGRPQVAYRETVLRGVTGLLYRHVKQDGGSGQFAHVVIDVEPLPDGDFVFASTVVGGRVPKEYVKAVEAGCHDALVAGPLGGHRVVGVRVTLTDGATHPKDSSELAFRTAGMLALRDALRAATMGLLEPMAQVSATVPAGDVGGVLGDLAARRGRIDSSAARAEEMVVTATVPLAELFGYATQLRSHTRGRGTFSTRPAGYAAVRPAGASG